MMPGPLDLNDLLGKLSAIHVGVVGDFCLDAYWDVDVSRSEQSVETGLETRPVRLQRYSLGAAGNVANNLRSMGVGRVSAYGATGRDPFGHKMRGLMDEAGIRVEGLFVQDDEWDTHAYIKPLAGGVESERMDFGTFNKLNDELVLALGDRLIGDLPDLDIVIVNQQVRNGIHGSELFQKRLQSLIAGNPNTVFLLDSRDMSRRYAGTIRKLNAYEAMVLTGAEADPLVPVCEEDARSTALLLAEEWGKPVFLTRGDKGCLVANGEAITSVPGLLAEGPTDPVGAGDSMIAGIGAALAAGCAPLEAATFGNIVAAVTVRKLNQTGTATPDEIRAVGS